MSGQGKSATNQCIVAPNAVMILTRPFVLMTLLCNELQRGLAGSAESLVATRDAAVHDVGQSVFAAMTGVEKGPGYHACRCGSV